MQPYILFALLWGLPLLFLFCSFSPWPKWMNAYRRVICGVLMMMFLYAAGLTTVSPPPSASKTPTGFLAEQVVKALNLLRPGQAPAWLLTAAVTVYWFRDEISELVKHVLKRGGSMELGGVKLQLPGEAAPTSGGLPLALSLVDVEPNLIDMGQDEPIFPGAIGKVQPGPFWAPPWYERLMAELPQFFEGMTVDNQDDFALSLKSLEEPISEEYEQYIATSAHYLSRHAKKANLSLNRFLSNALTVRRMMLYSYGRIEQGRLLVEDLPYLGASGTEFFFEGSLACWLLLGLCRDKQWSVAEDLRNGTTGFRHSEIVRTAFSAYIALARGRNHEAAELSQTALDVEHPAKRPLPAITLLQYVRAQSLYDCGQFSGAISVAEILVLGGHEDGQGLTHALRLAAMHVLTRACMCLGQEAKLLDLYQKHALLRNDPFLLNALAVIHGRKGQSEQALDYLRQAEANLPRQGGEDLHRVIGVNRKVLIKE